MGEFVGFFNGCQMCKQRGGTVAEFGRIAKPNHIIWIYRHTLSSNAFVPKKSLNSNVVRSRKKRKHGNNNRCFVVWSMSTVHSSEYTVRLFLFHLQLHNPLNWFIIIRVENERMNNLREKKKAANFSLAASAEVRIKTHSEQKRQPRIANGRYWFFITVTT